MTISMPAESSQQDHGAEASQSVGDNTPIFISRAQRIRSVSAATIGNAFEYYDFFLYGTASALIFNRLFFPMTSPMLGAAAAFAGYGVGFISRPIGGLVFGYIGDRYGRKITMTWTLALMGAATVAIGLLPTYQQAGIFAPIALILLRVVQGFAAGGEWGGAILMATENAPPQRRGFYGAWSQAGIGIGLIMSAGAFYIVQMFGQDIFLGWAWRVPFLASFIIVIAGLIIRAHVPESAEFERAARQESRSNPLRDVIRSNGKLLLVAGGLRLAEMSSSHLMTSFSLAYGHIVGADEKTLLLCVMLSMAADSAMMLFFGHLSDRIGRKRVYSFGIISMALFSYPFFWAIGSGSTVMIVTAFLIGNGICHAAMIGVEASLLADLFPVTMRSSGLAIAQAIAAVFVGFVPVGAMLLYYATGTIASTAALLVAICLISLGSLGAAYRLHDSRPPKEEFDHNIQYG